MEVQNSNQQADFPFQVLTQISHQIVSYQTSAREYRQTTKLTDAYTYVYVQCTSKPTKSQDMFNRYKQILMVHLMSYIQAENIEYNEHVFEQTNRLWHAYIKFAKIISRQVFSYLDRYFLPAREHGNLIDVAVSLFDQNVFASQANRKAYKACFANSIRTMRNNMIITQNHIGPFTKILYPINTELFYEIKKCYVEQTQAFYQSKFREIKQLDPLYYYNAIVNLVYFEETLSALCLYSPLQPLLMPIANHFIHPYTDIFIAHPKGFLSALATFNIPLLTLVTDIYSKFEGFDKIKKSYYEYIVSESRELIKQLEVIEDVEKVVKVIGQFLNKQQRMLTGGFKRHQQMHVTLSNALQCVIGKWDKLQEILLKFCQKAVEEGRLGEKSAIITPIFDKISNKDEFIHKCEAWIQSTILTQKAAITQIHQFAAFLHQICGTQNTNRLNKLVNDYLEQNAQPNKQQAQVRCIILSHHLWQRRFKEEIAVCLCLPLTLQNTWNGFAEGYSLMNPKKRLRLLPMSSQVVLDLRFRTTLLTLRCNLLQASIIISLAQRPKTEQELFLHINSEKHLISSFVASAKFISTNSDGLWINWDCEEKGFRDYTEQLQQKSKFIKAIEQDRNILLEAATVRMIKRRKCTTFEELYDHLCQTIKMFRPHPHMLKTTLQKLINRDFIETDEQGLYLYKE